MSFQLQEIICLCTCTVRMCICKDMDTNKHIHTYKKTIGQEQWYGKIKSLVCLSIYVFQLDFLRAVDVCI